MNIFPIGSFDSAGVIQAGMCIEIDGDDCTSIFGNPTLDIFGKGGLQPNLDYLHTLSILGMHRNNKLMYGSNFQKEGFMSKVPLFISSLLGGWKMIYEKALISRLFSMRDFKKSNTRSDIHGIFLKKGIDMATLRLSPTERDLEDVSSDNEGIKPTDKDTFEWVIY
jgi:hypothetical protein